MPENNTDLSLFEQKQIRRVWHKNEWYYSLVDVIAVLTDSPNPRNYWSMLKARLRGEEGFDESQIEQLKLKSPDNRFRLTDTATRQTLLRIIQSVPSPRAEPFRLWLAQVGEERIEEIENPEAAIERVREMYRAKGYDDAWIEARIKNDLIRNELTDEWQVRGAQEGREYAILTNELTKGTFGFTVQTYKEYKVLPARANLRDHMTPIELALTSLSEATAITYHRDRDSQGFPELHRDTRDAGRTAGKARKAIEEDMGHSVVSQENYLDKAGTRQQKRIKQSKKSEASEQGQPSLFDEPIDEE